MKKIILTDKAPKPIGPYSQGVLINKTLYCSGQIPIDAETGEMSKGDITEQTQKVIQNISAVLSGAGMGFENVVKTTCFLSSMADFGKFNDVYQQFFVSNPARSCVAAAGLPKGALVEIEVIASEEA